MQIKQWNVNKLYEYDRNPRKNDHAVEAVARAIESFGFNVPILIRGSGEIIDGHLRYKAARSLGLENVPVIIADHLSEEQIRAFRISVNKVAELAKWDMKLLEAELLSLDDTGFDMTPIGFTEVELESLIGHHEKAGDKDAVPEVDEVIVKSGDRWLLGDHVLYVGDATVPKSYDLLLAGDPVDMVWTDPPYNVNYEGAVGKIKNDNMSGKEFNHFLAAFYKQIFAALKPGGPVYVAHADGLPSVTFRQQFVAAGFKYGTCLIWRKNHSTFGRSDYHYRHEPILYGWKPGSAHCWYGGRKRTTMLEFGGFLAIQELSGGGIR